MNKEIKLKSVILYSTVILICLLAVDFYFAPRKYLNFDFIEKHVDNITSVQEIAPQRLFVNVWRTARNEYFDVSMNSQEWLRWRNRYLKHIKTKEDAYIAIDSMLASLNDPYTKFLKTKMYEQQKDIVDSKITGIGIIISKSSENVVVSHIVDKSPAQKSNVLPGDVLISINGNDIKSDNVDKIFSDEKIMKSKRIKIKIKRNDEIIEKTMEKSRIPIKTMDYKIKGNIAVITLATIMGESAINDFVQIIKETNDVKGIIIDLRDNLGGVLSNAIEMANYMLDNEKIVSVESRGNNKFQLYAGDDKVFKDKPTVILVNKNTASAAEILTGTLKDNNGAIVVGENTFGKNSIQHIIPMCNNTGLVITTNRYILPMGEDIHGSGIKPDVYIKREKNHEDNQMAEALKILNMMMKNNE